MSRRNFGGFLSANEQATDSASANGIYTLSEAQQKTALGVFPTGRWTPQRSVRFKGTNSYFSRSISSLGTKFTFSCWVKRSRINSTSSSSQLFQLWNGVTGNAGLSCFFTYTGYGTADMIYLTWDTYISAGNGYSNSMYTTSLFRDPSAWYHVVIVADTVVPTFARAFKIYVNGVQQSMTLGTEYNSWSSGLTIPGSLMNLGASNGGAGYANFYDGYWSENVFVDGQALTPSSFAFTDPETGTWVPKRYTGSYGTNGYYLPFNDATSTTTIGYDRQLGFTDTSKNNFTSTNISVTTGNTYDSMVDVPGIPSVTSQLDIGGVQRGNYATLNPIYASNGSSYSNANLQGNTNGSSAVQELRSTIEIPTSGKWYCEMQLTDFCTSPSGTARATYGVHTSTAGQSSGLSFRTESSASGSLTSAAIVKDGVSQGSVTVPSTNDILGFAIDSDASSIEIFRQGSSIYSGSYSFISGNLFIGVSGDSSGESGYPRSTTTIFNFGQRPFAYTPPTGYKTLCTTNLPNPVIKRPSDHFDIKTWTGTGKAMTITNTAKQSSTHQVPRSLRFRYDQSAYLTRTSTAGDTQKFTESIWFKRGKLASEISVGQWLGLTHQGPASSYGLYFDTNDTLNVYVYYTGSAWNGQLVTTQTFKERNAWNHFVLSVDTTATATTDRIKLYYNGTRITSFSTANYPSQNQATTWNTARTTPFNQSVSSSYYDGYVAEVNYIDGQALSPTLFGDFDASNNWMAKKYTGSYGTNGFYLPFNDPTSTTTIGYDRQISLTDNSKNNFTSSGIYLTSSTAANPYDAMYDSPTDYDDGTAVRGNYATFSPQIINGSNTIDSCNLRTTCTNASGWNSTSSTMPFPNYGKWYCEFYIEYRGDYSDRVGINVTSAGAITSIMTSNNVTGASNANYWSYYGHAAAFYNGGTAYGSGAATYGTSDLIALAYDGSTGSLWYGKQTGATGSMVWQNSGNPATGANPAFTGLYNVTPGAEGYSNAVIVCNYGQRPWSATPPTGFVGLNTKSMKDVGAYNLPDNFGNFVNTPDLVWLKSRSSSSYGHRLTDTVRGPTKQILSHSNTAESTDANGLQTFLPNGFQVGTGGDYNASGVTFVGWAWNRGVTPGFDIVQFTTTATTGSMRVPHSLGAVPKFIIMANLTSAYNWDVYHADRYSNNGYRMILNSVSQDTNTPFTTTAPTANDFGYNLTFNGISGSRVIAYLWSEVPGFSKFGTYTGNASSDGAFIYCGFRPKWILMKRRDNSSVTYGWLVVDTSRYTANASTMPGFWLDTAAAESSGAYTGMDITSNGFKLRENNANYNAAEAYIFAAFAETPFKYANAR